MPKKKNTSPYIVISTEDGLASACNRYVELALGLEKEKVRLEQHIARLKTEWDESHRELIQEIDGLVSSIQLFAETRPDLFPASADEGPRSREYGNARVGFRTNPPKVEKRLSKDTWDAIARRIKELGWGEQYVVEADPTVDKVALLRDRKALADVQLQQAGIRFVQEETFFIDPISDAAPAVRKEAA